MPDVSGLLRPQLRPIILSDTGRAMVTRSASATHREGPPDGHTFLLVAPPNAINASLYDRLNFNFIRDVAPVAGAMPPIGACSKLSRSETGLAS